MRAEQETDAEYYGSEDNREKRPKRDRQSGKRSEDDENTEKNEGAGTGH